MAQAAALGLIAAGGAMQYKSAIDEARSYNNAAKYNAAMDEQNAQATEEQSRIEEQKLRQHSRKVLGEARANYAASGVTLEGSPMDVLEESAANAEMDALNIRYMGKTKAQMFRSSAALERYKGEEALRQGRTKAAAALLGTGGRMIGAM